MDVAMPGNWHSHDIIAHPLRPFEGWSIALREDEREFGAEEGGKPGEGGSSSLDDWRRRTMVRLQIASSPKDEKSALKFIIDSPDWASLGGHVRPASRVVPAVYIWVPVYPTSPRLLSPLIRFGAVGLILFFVNLLLLWISHRSPTASNSSVPPIYPPCRPLSFKLRAPSSVLAAGQMPCAPSPSRCRRDSRTSGCKCPSPAGFSPIRIPLLVQRFGTPERRRSTPSDACSRRWPSIANVSTSWRSRFSSSRECRGSCNLF